MNFKAMSDKDLERSSERARHNERSAITLILHHLLENERRRLFSKLKFPSLFEYSIQRLKYSESEAIRRISAMRLIRDFPNAEQKIASGALTLTNAVLAQSLFSKEKKAGRPFNNLRKAEVLTRLDNQSTRKAVKIVCEISPLMKKTAKGIGFEMIRDESLYQKLEKVRGLYAHTNPNINLEDLLHKLCDEKLSHKSPSAPKVKTEKVQKEGKGENAERKEGIPDAERAESDEVPERPATPVSQAEIRRQVWRRDLNQCTHCQSTYALEIDHVVPRAAGGPSTLENMRLLCRNCNQRAAIEYFGLENMATYFEPQSKAH